MESRTLIICLAYLLILCNSNTESSAITSSDRTKCRSGVIPISNGRQAKVVTPVPTKKNGYGLVDDQGFSLTVKITEDFEYIQLHLNFGSWPYNPPPRVTAEQLGLKEDGLWHQLLIELKPTDLPGIDKWHIYIKSDQKDEAHDINTGYEWHYAPYKPKFFTVYAKGKSYWIPRGNASVCNAVDKEKRAAGDGRYGHLKIGNSASSAPLIEMNLLNTLLLPLLLLMRMAAAQAVD